MDARQQQYLEAMGITPWVRRDLLTEAVEDKESLPVSPSNPVLVLPVAGQTDQRASSAPVMSAAPVSPPPVAASAMVQMKHPQPAAPLVPAIPASDWDGLAQQVEGCQHCGLFKTRMNAVLGAGHHRARWMLVGAAPGADEDKQHQPLVGEPGQLLDAMLQAVGVKREAVYLTNMIKCRPPGNRRPKAEEVSACSGYLRGQTELLQPGLIIALGEQAAQALLQTEASISQLRGQIHYYGEQQIPLLVTHHPAHLLNTPADKRDSWQDLQRAMLECSPALSL